MSKSDESESLREYTLHLFAKHTSLNIWNIARIYFIVHSYGLIEGWIHRMLSGRHETYIGFSVTNIFFPLHKNILMSIAPQTVKSMSFYVVKHSYLKKTELTSVWHIDCKIQTSKCFVRTWMPKVVRIWLIFHLVVTIIINWVEW